MSEQVSYYGYNFNVLDEGLKPDKISNGVHYHLPKQQLQFWQTGVMKGHCYTEYVSEEMGKRWVQWAFEQVLGRGEKVMNPDTF